MHRIRHLSYTARLLLPALLCWLLPLSGKAQEHMPLSYPSFTPSDTGRVCSLIREGFFLMNRNADSAIILFRKAAQISRETGFEDGIGSALTFMAAAATSRGHYKQGFDLYKQAYPYCFRATYLKSALPVLYINMGASWFQAGDYARANELYYKALDYLQKHLPGDANIIMAYINLATVQEQLGRLHEALSFALKAEQIATEKNIPVALGSVFINIGSTYRALQQPDSAMHYFKRTLALAREHHFTDMQQFSLTAIGDLLLDSGKITQAIACYQQAIMLSHTTNALYGFILPRYSLARAWYYQGAYEQARSVLQEALTMARQTGLTENEPDAHAVLARVFEATGRYREALEQQKIYQQLNDSVGNVAKIRAIHELEVKYKTAEKDRELAQKELKIIQQGKTLNRKNDFLAGIGSVIALLLASGFAFYRYRRKISIRESEIKQLKAMMTGEENERARISRELHDGLGGMLTGIKMNLRAIQKGQGAATGNLDSIMHMLQDMGEEIHKTAHNLMPDVLVKHDLPEAIRLYCGQLHTGDLALDLQFYGTFNTLGKSLELSLYRIIQELVQNIIKHAGASQAAIQVRNDGETLCISAEDNGKGFSAEDRDTGLGLQNVATRVKALSGYCSISSSPGKGAVIYIEIDLKKINHYEYR